MKRPLRSSLAIAVFTFAPALAQSQMIYAGGTPDIQSNSWGITGYQEAMNFVLANDATVQRVRIYSIIFNNSGQGTGQFQWSFFTNSAGGPGSLIASGVSTPVKISESMSVFTTDTWDFLVSPTSFSAGTEYWLSVTNINSTDPAGGLFWRSSFGSPSSIPSVSRKTDIDAWTSNPCIDSFGCGNRLAFDLYADTTPEPSSIALLGTGLIGLFPVIRRRKRP